MSADGFSPIRAALVGAAVCAVFTPVVGVLARRLGVVSKPRPDRWNGRPVPMLGGIAVYIGAIAGLLAAAPYVMPRTVGIVLAAAFLLVVGALDDRFSFRPQTKLVAQILGACIVTGFGVGFQLRPFPALNVLFSIFWLVAVINSINLMDNMDGLAPGVSLVASIFLSMKLTTGDHLGGAALAAGLAGSLGGFLLFNFPPARIFMGDAGSLSVGIMLGGMSLSSSLAAGQKLGALSILLGPALVLAVPLLDVLLVSLTRILRGQSISQGGRDHSSHRLIMLGLSERKALVVFYTMAAASGLVGMAVSQPDHLRRSLVLVPLSWIPLGLFFAWLARLRMVVPTDEAPKGLAVVVGWVFKRRMAEVAMDMALAFACFTLAYLLRFDFSLEPVYWGQVFSSGPWVLGLTAAIFQLSGVYEGFWEHYGFRDVFRIAKAAGFSSLACIATAVILYRFGTYPRSVFPLYGLLLFVAALAVRASFRLFEALLVEPGASKVLILGTGPAAMTAYADLTAREGNGVIAGFIDATAQRSGAKIHGLPVFSLEGLSNRNGSLCYDRIVVAEESPCPRALKALGDLARGTGKSLQRFEARYTDV